MAYLKKTLKKISKAFGIELMILFGSLATGFTTAASDADVAISTKKHLSFRREHKLRHELAQIFQREVDLVYLDRVSPLLGGQIVKSGVLLCGDKKKFNTFRAYAMLLYLDFEPYFKLREKMLKRIIKQYHAG